MVGMFGRLNSIGCWRVQLLTLNRNSMRGLEVQNLGWDPIQYFRRHRWRNVVVREN